MRNLGAWIMLALSAGCFTQRSPESRYAAALDSLKQRTDSLEAKVQLLQASVSPYSEALLDCGTSGYARMDATGGFFLVSCDDATPYLDGYKVTLDIGNPSLMTYKAATLTVRWASSPFWLVDSAGIHTLSTELLQDLRPGAWTTVSLTLAPAKADQLKNLGVSIGTNRVSLSK